jgi:hypothetical protein
MLLEFLREIQKEKDREEEQKILLSSNIKDDIKSSLASKTKVEDLLPP